MSWEKEDLIQTRYGWYRLDTSHKTNVHEDYLSTELFWNEWAALRECIQNALDEADIMSQLQGGEIHDYISIKRRGERVILADRGRGVDVESILLIGKSGKRGAGLRGDKGEGQLMSFLVFTRLGIDIEMFSRDWLARPRFENFNGSDANTNKVLVVDFYRCTDTDSQKALKEGSVWHIERTSEIDEMVATIGDYFPEISPAAKRQAKRRKEQEQEERWREQDAHSRKQQSRERNEIRRKSTTVNKPVFRPRKGTPARLYLRGIYVKDLTDSQKALWSYNLVDASIDRDRKMVNELELLDDIAEKMGSEYVTPSMAREYWEHAKAQDRALYLEFRVVPRPQNDEVFEMWAKAFWKVFGPKTCIYTNSYAAGDAAREGWNVIPLDNIQLRFALDSLGVKTDKQAAGFTSGDFKLVDKVTQRETDMITKTLEIFDLLGLAQSFSRFHVVGTILGDEETEAFAYAGEIYVTRKAFKRGGLHVLECALHEKGHIETLTQDFTRGFTHWFLHNWVQALRGTDLNRQVEIAQKIAELESI